MKKGTLTWLGRKPQSLYDTSIEKRDLDDVELVLDSTAFPESGTAKVRARPTVKHYSTFHTPSSDIVQGFAVPTPQVPPVVNGPGITARENGEKSARYMNGLMEENIYIPPPPAMKPPPPPQQFVPIPPPTKFAGDSVPISPTSPNVAFLKPPPMSTPKPPGQPVVKEPDLYALKPPPMAPPKPPTNTKQPPPSPQVDPNLSDDFTIQRPRYAPPMPPMVPQKDTIPQPPPSRAPGPPVLPKTPKMPPPKPHRDSSMPNRDVALQPPILDQQGSTPSSFNPQNTAKIYSTGKTAPADGQSERERKAKSLIFLQDPNRNVLPIQVNGKATTNDQDLSSSIPVKSLTPPVKPARRNSSGLQLEKDLQPFKDKIPSYTPISISRTPPKPGAGTHEVDATIPAASAKVSPPTDTSNLSSRPAALAISLPKPEDVPKPSLAVSPQEIPQPSLSPCGQELNWSRPPPISPIRHQKHNISRTPYPLRATDVLSASGPSQKDRSKSPLDLLNAAKQRSQNRPTLTSQSNNNSSSSPLPSASLGSSIHPSESNPNSFTVTPRSPGSLESAGSIYSIPTHKAPNSLNSPNFSSSTLVSEHLNKLRTDSVSSTSSPVSVRDAESGEDTFFIPPPPEFANSDMEEESSPVQRDPPPSWLSSTTVHQNNNPPPSTEVKAPASLVNKSKAPLPPPKPQGKAPVPSPPRFPPPKSPTQAKPKPPAQASVKPDTPAPAGLLAPSSALTPSQMTLQSILQKKMLEMEQKHVFQQAEASSDEWGTSYSEDESSGPAKPSFVRKDRSPTSRAPPAQLQDQFLNELGTKLGKKPTVPTATTKTATSEPQTSKSKQPYGMTFTVRPGTKQPITLVSKGEPM
ncbi:uncharacterized protein C6orf132 homolog isoform X2 [Amia ocellicauda]|uniref:uncharacterized protein C6orf132 homolog isoform X2 n=1 Tax=Amia ocellicauda TaxID=2972642 RepID=UPI00346493C0